MKDILHKKVRCCVPSSCWKPQFLVTINLGPEDSVTPCREILYGQSVRLYIEYLKQDV